MKKVSAESLPIPPERLAAIREYNRELLELAKKQQQEDCSVTVKSENDVVIQIIKIIKEEFIDKESKDLNKSQHNDKHKMNKDKEEIIEKLNATKLSNEVIDYLADGYIKSKFSKGTVKDVLIANKDDGIEKLEVDHQLEVIDKIRENKLFYNKNNKEMVSAFLILEGVTDEQVIEQGFDRINRLVLELSKSLFFTSEQIKVLGKERSDYLQTILLDLQGLIGAVLLRF